MILIYVAGPYRADTIESTKLNIIAARQVAADLVFQSQMCLEDPLSVFPVVPHTNTGLFDYETLIKDVPADYYLDGTMELLKRCGAMILTSWDAAQKSKGTRAEVQYANRSGIPVFASVGAFIRYETDSAFEKDVDAAVELHKDEINDGLKNFCDQDAYPLIIFGTDKDAEAQNHEQITRTP
jgi:hypothetical protein